MKCHLLFYNFHVILGRTDDSSPQERPQLSNGLRDMIADEGQPLSVTAAFVGNPIPEVSWTKDGAPLLPSERILLTCDGKRVNDNFVNKIIMSSLFVKN